MMRIGRRGLVAGALSLPGAARALEPMRGRLAALRYGANLERWFTIARDQRSRRLGPAWWSGFRAMGFDHARIFIPKVQETGTGEEVLGGFAEAVADATAAGLTVLLGLSDFYHHSSPWGAADWQALATRAAFFAARTDPGRVALAPINEPAFPDTATWLPVRDRLLAAVRAKAPRHTLMWGGREWCSPASLLEAPPPADPDTVAEAHDYGGGDAAAVRARFAPLTAWRQRHGIPALVTEMGGSLGHETDIAAWAADLRQSLPVLRTLELPAALWAYTHGGHWRLQESDGPVLRPQFRQVLQT